MASTICLSVRAIGTVPELIDNAIELWLPVGEVGVAGNDSSADVTIASLPAPPLGHALTCLCTCGTQNVGSSFVDTGLRLFNERTLPASRESTLYGMELQTNASLLYMHKFSC